MGKYFNNTDIDFIQSEEVVKLLHRADKRPENFIRIALREDGMHLDYKSHAEFEIYRAILFIRDIRGNIYRYDFAQNDSERCFYAAIDPGNFVAMSLYDPKYAQEKLYMFDNDESLIGILKRKTPLSLSFMMEIKTMLVMVIIWKKKVIRQFMKICCCCLISAILA